jgi:hypothetical protein
MRDAFHTHTSLYRLLKMALLEFVYKIRFYFLRKIVRILAKNLEFIDVKLYIKLIKNSNIYRTHTLVLIIAKNSSEMNIQTHTHR